MQMSSQGEEQLHTANRLLAQASPERIIQWARETYGPSLCFATMLDTEGCALLALLATEAPHVPVFIPDTGYLSPQVLSLREALQQRYKLPIRLVRPTMLTASFECDYGPLYQRYPSRCCRMNRWEPMREVFKRYTARIAARRRALCRTMKQIAPVGWDDALQLVQINPLVHWSDDDLQRHLRNQQVPHLPSDSDVAMLGCTMCSRMWDDVVPSEVDMQAPDGNRPARWFRHIAWKQ